MLPAHSIAPKNCGSTFLRQCTLYIKHLAISALLVAFWQPIAAAARPSPMQVFTPTYGQAMGIWYSQDGKVLVGHFGRSRMSNHVGIWQTTNGKAAATVGRVGEATACPKSNWLVIGRASWTRISKIEIWNLSTVKKTRVFRMVGGQGTRLQCGPYGKQLAAWTRKGDVWIWDLSKGRSLGVLQTGDGSPTAARFSLDGKSLLTLGSDGKVRSWNFATKASKLLFQVGKKTYRGAFSPDLQTLVSKHMNGIIKFWSMKKKALLASHKAHTSWGHYIRFAPNGKMLVSMSKKQLKLWNPKNGHLLATIKKADLSLPTFSPNSRILIANSGRRIWMWDANTARVIGKTGKLQLDGYEHFAFSPKGKMLALGRYKIKLWKMSTLLKSAP